MKVVVSSSLSLVSAVSANAATTANWLGGNGAYTDGSHWSTGAAPVTAAFNAAIATPGQVALSGTVTVNSLTLGNASAAINDNVGVLQASTLNVDAGTFNFLSATLTNTVVTGGANGGQFFFVAGQSPTLDNVRFATGAVGFDSGSGKSRVTVNNNLTINSSINVVSGNSFGFNNCALTAAVR